MRYHRIPDETIRRLPVYLRGLEMSTARGRGHISSQHLADFVGVNAWQIRKDFSYFGDFGTPGVGYDVQKLAWEIKRILRLDTAPRAALVGVGDLGSALLAYPGFAVYGLAIVAAFDTNPQKIGRKDNGVEIEPLTRLGTLSERGIQLAIVAVPAKAAQDVVDALVETGVRGILNFAPSKVVAPPQTKIITLDIAMELARLPYYMPASE